MLRIIVSNRDLNNFFFNIIYFGFVMRSSKDVYIQTLLFGNEYFIYDFHCTGSPIPKINALFLRKIGKNIFFVS